MASPILRCTYVLELVHCHYSPSCVKKRGIKPSIFCTFFGDGPPRVNKGHVDSPFPAKYGLPDGLPPLALSCLFSVPHITRISKAPQFYLVRPLSLVAPSCSVYLCTQARRTICVISHTHAWPSACHIRVASRLIWGVSGLVSMVSTSIQISLQLFPPGALAPFLGKSMPWFCTKARLLLHLQPQLRTPTSHLKQCQPNNRKPIQTSSLAPSSEALWL